MAFFELSVCSRFVACGIGPLTSSAQPGAQALRGARLKAFWGDDASAQPGQLQEMMLHETAVSWMRVRLAETVPVREWQETREQYADRLRRCVADINDRLDVDGLCRGFNKRVATLRKKKGGRLKW